MVHLCDISFILFTHVVEAANQVIPLLGEISQLGIQAHLVLSILDLCVTEVVQLSIQVSQSLTCLLVIDLKAFQIICLPQEVGVDRLGFSLNLGTQVFLFPQLVKQSVLLCFKAVQLFSKLGVEVSFVLQVVLQVAIDHVLE